MQKKIISAVSGIATLVMTGCAQVPVEGPAHDPAESFNREMYTFNDTVDQAVLGPIARGYSSVTPAPVRKGVTNFFDNIGYLDTVLNDFLQGKVTQGFSDTGRFLINSTVGIVGIFDVATPIGLEKNDEDLGQTFAVWGANEGAYLMLPGYGPSTVRDAPQYLTKYALDPLTYVEGGVTWPLTVLNIINTRANLESTLKLIRETSIDPYLSLQNGYRQRRTNLIYDGNPPEIDIMDDMDDEFFEEEEDLFEDEASEDSE